MNELVIRNISDKLLFALTEQARKKRITLNQIAIGYLVEGVRNSRLDALIEGEPEPLTIDIPGCRMISR